MKKELISVIVPCFNAEKTLERYLQSILEQTYKYIEIICVDDGSTDHTSEILKRYINIFKKNKMSLIYVYQQNAGLGAAINTGLKYVTGQYLCWSDPDDFYMKESMEKRIRILQEYPEYAIVSSDAYVFKSDNLCNPLKLEAERFEHRYEENQFELLIKEESHFCAGCHMIRMSDFESVNPERTIYPARRGQNWQLLLPVYYKYKRYFLDEPLYAYVLYPESMSVGDITEEKELKRWKEHEDIICQTLKKIPLDFNEQKRYEALLFERYAKKRFYTAIDYRDKKLLKEQYEILKYKSEDIDDIKKMYRRNYYFVWKVFYKLKEMVG